MGAKYQSQVVRLFVHLEGVGEDSPLKGHVLPAHAGVVGVLHVHDHDVVCKQEDLVGVQLVGVLLGQGVYRHKLGIAHELGHVGARSGEGVEDVHVPVAEALPELPLECPVSGVQHVAHYLDGCVHDTELFARACERLAEEVIVEVLDEGLAVGVGAAEARTTTHARIELV